MMLALRPAGPVIFGPSTPGRRKRIEAESAQGGGLAASDLYVAPEGEVKRLALG